MIQIVLIAGVSIFFIVACATKKEEVVETQKTKKLQEIPISKDLKPMYLGGSQLEKYRNSKATSQTKSTSPDSPQK